MHYTVGVITKEEPDESVIDEALAPFDENIEVEPYVTASYEEVKKKLLDHLKWMKENERIQKDQPEYLEQWKVVEDILERDDIPSLIDWNEDENYFWKINSNGEALSTYNPKSKYDWYTIGGRWSDDVIEGDMVQLKDYPKFEVFKKGDDSLPEKYPEEYKSYQSLIKEGDGVLYNNNYYKERFPDFADYLNDGKQVKTYAVLDENGVWHEPGQMGWFSSAATNEELCDFTQTFYEKFIAGKDENYWFTVVDCHI